MTKTARQREKEIVLEPCTPWKRKDHQIIKADIARELGVSAAKVDRLCRELLEEGYLRSDGGRALFLTASRSEQRAGIYGEKADIPILIRCTKAI